jgi:CRISPR/Cas system type I-B associated protein Csh2 (Cas7 group RAMP superfamily)
MNDKTYNRGCGILIIEVRNSNPNGDPDQEGVPRQRNDRHGEISAVSFKRKLRDLVEDKDGEVWKHLSADAELNLDKERFHILESRERSWQTALGDIKSKTFTDKYWDGRVFGNTFLESTKESSDADQPEAPGTDTKQPEPAEVKPKLTAEEKKLIRDIIKTGAAKFGMGISISPLPEDSIRRLTQTKKAGAQEGKDRGMAPLSYNIITYAVYAMPFFVNPSTGRKSGCIKEDIELMLRLIPFAYPHTASAIRPDVNVRVAHYIEHKSALGSFQDCAMIDSLMPTPRVPPDDSVKDLLARNYIVPKWEDLDEKLRSCAASYRELVSEFLEKSCAAAS